MKKYVALSLLMISTLTSCGVPAATDMMADMQPMRVQFAAAVNDQDFSCGTSFNNVGTTNSTLTPKDFRFYVHDVTLIRADGEAVPMQLEQDGKWQLQNIALLDFEDKTGSCDGNPDMNMEIKGMAPAGEYTGIKFKLGVPTAMNHGDPNAAESPLNLTSMFWTWRFGHKFARLDMTTTGMPQGYFIHLGSTACEAVEATESTEGNLKVSHAGHDHGDEHKGNCANPNIAEITIEDFDVNSDTLVADLGQLLAESNIDTNQEETAAGCMSSPDDADCEGIMKNFGLKEAPQRFFRKK